ncbi:UNVERIFIED_CONTAM: hypothetical protein FKN15_022001 [Acipenser sinensis]
MKENTAVQEEQNRKWRQERGLPEQELTELELLLQQWEQAGAALLFPAPKGETPLFPEPEEVLSPAQDKEEPLLSPEPPAENKGEEVLPPEQDKEEEVKKIPPPQPRPLPLKTRPVPDGAVPHPVLLDTLPECPDLQLLGLEIKPEHHQTQFLAWSPALFFLKPQRSRHSRQTSLGLPLVAQTSLRRGQALNLCLLLPLPDHQSAHLSPQRRRDRPILKPARRKGRKLTFLDLCGWLYQGGVEVAFKWPVCYAQGGGNVTEQELCM